MIDASDRYPIEFPAMPSDLKKNIIFRSTYLKNLNKSFLSAAYVRTEFRRRFR